MFLILVGAGPLIDRMRSRRISPQACQSRSSLTAKKLTARNLDFERRKNEYFQRVKVALFALTANVLSQRQWTPEVLEERQAEGRMALVTQYIFCSGEMPSIALRT